MALPFAKVALLHIAFGTFAIAGDNPYIRVVEKIQRKLPPGWTAEYRSFSEYSSTAPPAVKISSPPMQAISTDPNRPTGEVPRYGRYSLTLSIYPRLLPENYATVEASDEKLRAQLSPRTLVESDQNKKILAQMQPLPDFYDEEYSYGVYSSLRPTRAADIERCKEMFQRLSALFKPYERSPYHDAKYYESRLYWRP